MAPAPKFSDTEILAACHAIISRGNSVSPTALTKQLKGGSVPYFQSALLRLRLAGSIEGEDPDESGSKAMLDLLRPLWLEVRSMAASSFVRELADVRTNADRKIKDAQDGFAKARQKIELLETSLRYEQEKNKELALQNAQLSRSLDEKAEMISELDKRIAKADENEKHNKEKYDAIIQEQHNLKSAYDFLMQSTAEERRVNTAAHNEQTERLNRDIAALRSRVDGLVFSNAQCTSQKESLENNLKKANNEIESFSILKNEFGSADKIYNEIASLKIKVSTPPSTKLLDWTDMGDSDLEAKALAGKYQIDRCHNKQECYSVKFVLNSEALILAPNWKLPKTLLAAKNLAQEHFSKLVLSELVI